MSFLFFIALLSPQSVQYLSWNFFSCGSFSSVPSPMISSAFSFRIPLGLEFLSLPWLSISHFHFSIFWCFLYDISSSPWINSSINYSSLLFSLHIKVFFITKSNIFHNCLFTFNHLLISLQRFSSILTSSVHNMTLNSKVISRDFPDGAVVKNLQSLVREHLAVLGLHCSVWASSCDVWVQ